MKTAAVVAYPAFGLALAMSLSGCVTSPGMAERETAECLRYALVNTPGVSDVRVSLMTVQRHETISIDYQLKSASGSDQRGSIVIQTNGDPHRSRSAHILYTGDLAGGDALREQLWVRCPDAHYLDPHIEVSPVPLIMRDPPFGDPSKK